MYKEDFQRNIDTVMFRADQADLLTAQQAPAVATEAQPLPDPNAVKPVVVPEAFPTEVAARQVQRLRSLRNHRAAPSTGHIAMRRRSQ